MEQRLTLDPKALNERLQTTDGEAIAKALRPFAERQIGPKPARREL